MKNYMLVLRHQDARFDTMPPDEMQAVLDTFNAWNRSLREKGEFLDAGKLTDDLGGTLRRREGALVLDGPFSEAKEAIAGFYLVQAESFEAAEKIASGCPILNHGGSVELRELSYLASQ